MSIDLINNQPAQPRAATIRCTDHQFEEAVMSAVGAMPKYLSAPRTSDCWIPDQLGTRLECRK
jgi:hypothetical protein